MISWERIVSGDKDAFHDLYQECSRQLYSYGMKIVNDPQRVKEEIQSLFVYIFEKRKSLSEPNNLFAYLASSLRRNLCRKAKVGTIVSLDSATVNTEFKFNIVDDSSSVSDVQNLDKRCNAIREAIKTLSPQQKEIIYLRFFQKLSVEEVAEILTISQQTVRNVTYNSLQKLRSDKTLHDYVVSL